MNKERSKDETLSVYSIDSAGHLVGVKSRDTYFKRRRKKLILTALLALSLLMISLLVGIVTISILYGKLQGDNVTLCDSEECVRIAASLKESMDPSIDPCEDFYKYACGRWENNHPTPDTNMMNSWFNERSDKVIWKIRELLRKNITEGEVPWSVFQAKTLYDSCMNLDSLDSLGLTPLLNLLKQLDLPQIPAIFTKKDGNFIQKLVNVRRYLGKDVFIGFDIIPDPRNKSKNVILLDTPSTLSPLPGDKEVEKRLKSLKTDWSMSDDQDKKSGPKAIEKTYIKAIIKEIINNGTSSSICDETDETSTITDKEIEKAADRIYETTALLFYISRADSNETLTDEDLQDKDYMLVDDIEKITNEYVKKENGSLEPIKIWRPFIEGIFHDSDTINLDKEKILVGNMGYLKYLSLFLASTDEETLETIIWWVIVDIITPHSSKNLRDIWTEYIDKLVKVEMYYPRSLHCADVVNTMMGMAVSWLFVDPKFHTETGPKVIEMLEHIKSSFVSLVSKLGWMDQRTKSATLEKTSKMAYVIGYPDWLFNEDKLNDFYKGADMGANNYLENMIKLAKLMTESELELISEVNTINDTFWPTAATDVNAIYTVTSNHITVPAGILQFPFYQLGLEALNYGAIGTVLGHELTHGFDNSGRLYDGDGNLRQWWSNDTIIEYKFKVECFIKHYQSYYEEEVDDYIDGELTLDENIADNGGLREAVYAYRRWIAKNGQEPKLPGFTYLSHEQLLFLGFAHLWCEAYTPESLKWMLKDTHSPGHVRLKAVLTNSREFSDAWKCPVGSPMNPYKKCQIW